MVCDRAQWRERREDNRDRDRDRDRAVAPLAGKRAQVPAISWQYSTCPTTAATSRW